MATEPVTFYAKNITTTTTLILSLDFNGVDASTVFTDLSTYGHTCLSSGGAQIDTDQSVDGASSVLFGGGALNHVEISRHAVFGLGTASFIIDFYYFADGALGVTKGMFSQWGDSGNDGSFYIYHTLAGGNQPIRFNYSSDGGSEVVVDWGIGVTSGTWFHLRAHRDDTNIFFYANDPTSGTLALSTQTTGMYSIDTISIHTSSFRNLNISSYQDGLSANHALNGWIDNLTFYKEITTESEARFHSRADLKPVNFYS